MVSGEALDIIVKRSIHRGRIWSAHPQLLLADGPDELVSLSIPGTDCRIPRGVRDMETVRHSFRTGDWDLVPSTWTRFIGVCRNSPGRYYNVTHLFEPASGEFLCWYVSIERPITRHDDGLVVDTTDLWLDLIVLPDGKPFWKDTDNWAWAADNDLYSPAEVLQVDEVRDELLDHATAGTGPFDGTWTEWAPIDLDPLALPSYWDRPSLVVDTREAADRS